MQEHKKEETVICPNCGFAATKNYCAQCGQETHLHKETFIGLVTHFVGHYFHYDSKFWGTLKMLFTKPGMLTAAYWEKKRMRFIPPISLYIFVSIVFFFFFFSTVGSEKQIREMAPVSAEDSLIIAGKLDSLKQVELLLKRGGDANVDSLERIAAAQTATRLFSSTDEMSALMSKLIHSAPKIFFFMIPIMAFVLRLLYRKRKDVHFVDHSIFSLHIHAFAFILLLPYLYDLPELSKSYNWIDLIISLIQNILPFLGLAYLVVAIHNAYKSSWVRSTLYGLVISASYLFFFTLVALGYFIFVLTTSIHP